MQRRHISRMRSPSAPALRLCLACIGEPELTKRCDLHRFNIPIFRLMRCDLRVGNDRVVRMQCVGECRLSRSLRILRLPRLLAPLLIGFRRREDSFAATPTRVNFLFIIGVRNSPEHGVCRRSDLRAGTPSADREYSPPSQRSSMEVCHAEVADGHSIRRGSKSATLTAEAWTDPSTRCPSDAESALPQRWRVR